MTAKEKTRSCFVIMPFSKTTEEHDDRYWNGHFEFLKGLIEQNAGLEAHRSEALRTDIIKQIIADLITCDVVVADVTDHNPNVFWELGVRQSFKSGTITIAQEGTDLPFDIDKKGTLFYCPNSHIKNAQFVTSFNRAIKDCMDNPQKCDSSILESVTGRGTIFEMFQRDETLRRLEAVLSECDSNSKLFSRYIENCKKNAALRSSGKKNEVSFSTSLLRSLALELLIAQRYVNEPPEFYKHAESVHDLTIARNTHINKWSDNAEWAEKWLLKSEDVWNRTVTQFRESVVIIQNKISQNI